METVVVAARLALAAVFAVSAAAKLLDREGTRKAVEAFGLPPGLTGPVAAGLPVAEAATAVLLVPGTTARAGGLIALGLLAAFIAGISVNLAQGRHPDCACFGQLSSTPVGPLTIARNVVLAAAAGLIAFGDGSHAGGAVGPAFANASASAIAVAASVAAAVLIALFASTRKGATLIADAPAGPPPLPPALPVGSPAPAFTLVGTSGRDVSLTDLLARRRRLLVVFFSPACTPCAEIAPELARWQRELSDRLTVAVLSSGTAEKARSSVETYGLAEVLHDERGAVAKAYGSRGTPGAVLLEPTGEVASDYAPGAAAISDLIIQAFGLTDLVAAVSAGREPRPDGGHEGHDHAAHEHPVGGADAEPGEPLVDPAEIGPAFVPVGRPDVSIAEHDGETVLVDAATGAVHLLNPTAAIVWQCLDGSGSVAEIVADIADVFERQADEVEGAVLEVVRRFGMQGLLRGVGVERESEPAGTGAGEEHRHE
jgi:peroxiredoxin